MEDEVKLERRENELQRHFLNGSWDAEYRLMQINAILTSSKLKLKDYELQSIHCLAMYHNDEAVEAWNDFIDKRSEVL